MKKCFALLLILFLIPTFALSEPDLSGMSYDELVALKDRINLAMWNSQEWQEVTVPQGVWIVGEDIPAGKWTVKCANVSRSDYLMVQCYLLIGTDAPKSNMTFSYQDSKGDYQLYNPNHKNFQQGQMTEISVDLVAGDYVVVHPTYAPAVFTPYTGKPDLGFK